MSDGPDISDRGLLREGFHADIVILDLDTVHDKATFSEPHQSSERVEHVLINGQSVVENGRPTAALAGMILSAWTR